MISKLNWDEIKKSLIKMIDNKEYQKPWKDKSQIDQIGLRIPLHVFCLSPGNIST